jgi:hypothetical protein
MTHHQIPLFDRPTLNIIKAQKEAMNRAVRLCGMSREQVLDRMNDLADAYGVSLASNGRLSMDIFEKWLNPNETNRQMPIKALPVFCAAVRDISSLDVLARSVGAMVIGEDDQRRLKWAEAYFKARNARKIMSQMEKEL